MRKELVLILATLLGVALEVEGANLFSALQLTSEQWLNVTILPPGLIILGACVGGFGFAQDSSDRATFFLCMALLCCLGWLLAQALFLQPTIDKVGLESWEFAGYIMLQIGAFLIAPLAFVIFRKTGRQ